MNNRTHQGKVERQDSFNGCSRANRDSCSFLLATSISQRARGLLFSRPRDEVLILMPCNDVHTVGMRYRLDIAFIDKRGRVLEAHRDVGPLHRFRNRRAIAVIERFSSCKTPWFDRGDRLAITRLKEVDE